MNEEELRALWLLSMSGDTKDFRPLLAYVRKVEEAAYQRGKKEVLTEIENFNMDVLRNTELKLLTQKLNSLN